MQRDAFERAADFIWRNARLLEKYRFAYHFLDGPQSAVIACLRSYQNPDGGFGNALEPDKRYPGSTPIDVATAFHNLDDVDGFADEMVTEACDFLETITTPEGGIPFTLPEVKQYPHAPWWGTDEADPPAAINPTAEICAMLLKHNVYHPWLEHAIPFCWQHIPSLPASFHNMMPATQFLQYAPDQTRAAAMLAKIKADILHENLVSFDRNLPGYVKYPLDWAPDPDYSLRTLFIDEEIMTDLKALEADQQSDGGWAINWEPISTAVELEWRGILTLRSLLTLNAYQQIIQ